MMPRPCPAGAGWPTGLRAVERWQGALSYASSMDAGQRPATLLEIELVRQGTYGPQPEHAANSIRAGMA